MNDSRECSEYPGREPTGLSEGAGLGMGTAVLRANQATPAQMSETTQKARWGVTRGGLGPVSGGMERGNVTTEDALQNPEVRRTSTTRAANQQRFRAGAHSAASPNASYFEIVHVYRQPRLICSQDGTLFDVASGQASTIAQSQSDGLRHRPKLARQKRCPRIEWKLPNGQIIEEDLDFGRRPLVLIEPCRHFGDVDSGHRSIRQRSSDYCGARLFLHHGEERRGV